MSTTPHRVLQPPDWPRPKGYANGMLARGEMVFVGGMIGKDRQDRLADGFLPQMKQALLNIAAVLAEAGGSPEHIVRLTWYVTDKKDYLSRLPEIGAAYRSVMGRHFPTMTLVQVVALVEDLAKVEIEATAVIPA